MRLALTFLMIAGCAQNGDPCAGAKGVCIGLRVEGSVTGLDQLGFTIDTPNTVVQKTPTPPKSFTLPVRVALFPPAGTTGTVHIKCDGTGGPDLLGHGEVDAILDSNGHAQATLTLLATNQSDMPIADLSGGGDGPLGDGPIYDLAACATITACMDSDGCCPPGCNNSNDKDCTPICGNKVVETGENCDDGNSTNGDGCDATCQWAGIMTTLSGLAGACGRADGPAQDARLGSLIGGIATDGTLLWFNDANTIRQASPPPLGSFTTQAIVSTIVGPEANLLLPGGPGSGLPLAYVSSNQKLYVADLVDLSGPSMQLREIDLATHLTSPIPTTQVKNDPVSLSTDGTTIWYAGRMGDLNKWTPGDPSSTQLVTATDIQMALPNISFCQGVLRSQAVTYLNCQGGVVQVTDAKMVSSYAGTASPEPSCADNMDKANAWFTGVMPGNSALAADLNGNVFVSACYAIREITTGVSTVAGQLNSNGYLDGPGSASLFGNSPSIAYSNAAILNQGGGSFYVGDGANCVVRIYSPLAGNFVQTVIGKSPSVHTLDVRGDAMTSRYPHAFPGAFDVGAVTDGSYLYALGHTQVSPHPTAVIKIDLTNGTSTDLATLSGNNSMWGITRIGNTLYVSRDDGTIHSVGTDGMNEGVFAGTAGNTTPPSDGTAGNLKSAVLFPLTLATDGTDLYFSDGNGLIRKITLATSTVSTIAGTAGTNDIADGTGGSAHFQFPLGLSYAQGNLYVLDGGEMFEHVIRRITLATREVKTIVGDATTSNPMSVDGVGLLGQVSAATSMTSDGSSLFISEGTYPQPLGDPTRSPAIRQLELSSLSLTTMVGTRGVLTIHNDTGTKALVHHPTALTFDAATHSLYFFDAEEGVYQKVR